MTETDANSGAVRRAVVVDDNTANLYYTGKILRHRGYEVFPAGSYYEALQALKASQSDLLLADIRLDRGSGIVLARLAREMQPWINVLLMTAYREEEVQAKDVGLPVIRIPFGSRDLIKRLMRGATA